MDVLLHSANAESLTHQITDMIAAGRTTVARPLLNALRQLSPPSAKMAELSARLEICDGQPVAASDELDRAILIEPEHVGLRLLRAQLRSELDDLPGAAQDAAEAVALDRRHPEAKALLGVLMLELGHAADARACLAEAVGMAPANPRFRQGLAAAEEAEGDWTAAVATLAAGIALNPGRIELRTAAILLQVRRRDFLAAVRLAEDARRIGLADACVFGLLGHSLSSLARHEEAGEAYREALKLSPDDPYVRHLVAASGFLPGATRAPPAYLSTIFDGYAERFEASLISLGYRVPGLLRAAVTEHFLLDGNRLTEPVLDLGCGTGLVAVVLADLPVGPFIGIDLSDPMLAQARCKKLYTELRHTDLCDFLAEDTRSWRLILAADVFCYFGALDDLLAAVFARLATGGMLMFSTEEMLPDAAGSLPANVERGWVLGRQGRYAHAHDYLMQVAGDTGFTVRSLRREALRFEANAPVAGFFLVLERPAYAS
jgi:predicted TPR repeat methyltransferase/thioredoxin-like negative regulator of GroEL